MVLLIDQNDINQIELTPRDVIDVVESAYRQDGKGLAEETPLWGRTPLETPPPCPNPCKQVLVSLACASGQPA